MWVARRAAAGEQQEGVACDCWLALITPWYLVSVVFVSYRIPWSTNCRNHFDQNFPFVTRSSKERYVFRTLMYVQTGPEQPRP